MRSVSARTMALVATTGMLAWCGLISAEHDDAVPFPVDYRTWAHVKSVVVGPQSASFATEAGIHHIYANDQALVGYRTGVFPDGSVVVYELLETKETAGNTIEGSRRRVDVMVKESQRHPDTAGWDFARFRGDDRTDGAIAADRKSACFSCHSKRKDRDFIFSEFRK